MTRPIIKIHKPEDFVGMRAAGRLAAHVLDHVAPHVQPGVTTQALNDICHAFIIAQGATPAPLGYHGFPRSVCTSVNHVVCHGIPCDKILKDGDIINIDVTVNLNGWHGDTSRMFTAGKAGIQARKLMDVTYECMMAAIDIVKPGITVGDIGHTIQTIAEAARYSVVRDFCGHGIGRLMHDAPEIAHFGRPGTGVVLQEGMFLTIEPMINAGDYRTKVLADGWTAVTRDRSLSAQFEHTLAVTADGYEIFTLSA